MVIHPFMITDSLGVDGMKSFAVRINRFMLGAIILTLVPSIAQITAGKPAMA